MRSYDDIIYREPAKVDSASGSVRNGAYLVVQLSRDLLMPMCGTFVCGRDDHTRTSVDFGVGLDFLEVGIDNCVNYQFCGVSVHTRR